MEKTERYFVCDVCEKDRIDPQHIILAGVDVDSQVDASGHGRDWDHRSVDLCNSCAAKLITAAFEKVPYDERNAFMNQVHMGRFEFAGELHPKG